MGKTDKSAKQYFRNKKVMAEVIKLNFPKADVRPKNIHFVDTSSMIFSKKRWKEYQRDLLTKAVIVRWKKRRFCFIGLEPQSYLDYALPIRSMLYDAIQYQTQRRDFQIMHREKKDLKPEEYLSGISGKDKFTPLVTILFWLGEGSFQGPTRLSQLMNWDEQEKEWFFDYGFHLIDPTKVEDSKILQCQTDLREVLLSLKNSSSKKQLEAVTKNNKDYRTVTMECGLLLKQTLNLNVKIEEGEDGRVNMCKAIEEIKEDGIQIGLAQGLEKGIYDTRNEIAMNILRMGISIADVSRMTGLDVKSVQKLQKAIVS